MSKTQHWGDLSLMGLFCLEIETQTNALSDNLLALEQSGWTDARALDNLMRAAHSIKGAARIVQVEVAVKVSHALEDCFIAAQQGILHLTSDSIDVLLKGIDLLAAVGRLEEAVLSEKMPEYEVKADAVVLAVERLVTEAEKATPSNSASFDMSFDVSTFDALTMDDPVANAVSDFLIDPLAPVEGSEATEPVKTVAIELDLPAVRSAALPNAQRADKLPRTIQISTDNLNRLMGIAGESLVDANWLQPFGESLLQLKRQQQSVIALLEKYQQSGSPRDDLTCEDSASDNTRSPDLDRAVAEMQSCHRLLGEQLSNLDVFSQRFSQLSDRLYREVIAGHMCAFEAGAQGCDRLIRDLSRSLNKHAVLVRTGLTTQIDRDILAKLETPITHLLTNAVVHGIELSERRLAQGKPAEGTIRLSALHRSGMLIVSIEDDGAGIDLVSLREKVVAKGLTTAEVADQLSASELLEFLFLPGFSTVAEADEVAGRGYGLDLARNMAQSVGGSLQIVSPTFEDSERGVSGGTRFQFQLPLTLSVVRSLLFEIAGEPYAMSLARIVSVVKLLPSQIYYSQGCPYFAMPGNSADSAENISLIWGHQVLGSASSVSGASLLDMNQQLAVIVIGEPGCRYGLCVDRLIEGNRSGCTTARRAAR